jgi:hypothetical protein
MERLTGVVRIVATPKGKRCETRRTSGGGLRSAIPPEQLTTMTIYVRSHSEALKVARGHHRPPEYETCVDLAYESNSSRLLGGTSAPQIARIRCRDQPTVRSWNGLWVRIPPAQPKLESDDNTPPSVTGSIDIDMTAGS